MHYQIGLELIECTLETMLAKTLAMWARVRTVIREDKNEVRWGGQVPPRENPNKQILSPGLSIVGIGRIRGVCTYW